MRDSGRGRVKDLDGQALSSSIEGWIWTARLQSGGASNELPSSQNLVSHPDPTTEDLHDKFDALTNVALPSLKSWVPHIRKAPFSQQQDRVPTILEAWRETSTRPSNSPHITSPASHRLTRGRHPSRCRRRRLNSSVCHRLEGR